MVPTSVLKYHNDWFGSFCTSKPHISATDDRRTDKQTDNVVALKPRGTKAY